MDATTVTVTHIIIFGLTCTEWMSKLREEVITCDLAGGMASDFFFAYDVTGFIAMATADAHVYHSPWLYVCFFFTFMAMFHYVPTQPVTHDLSFPKLFARNTVVTLLCMGVPFLVVRLSTFLQFMFHYVPTQPVTHDLSFPKLFARNTVVTLLCMGVPFLVVRLSTFLQFSFVVSDFIHILKNFAMVTFGIAQLCMVHRDVTNGKNGHDKQFIQKRKQRRSADS